MMPPRNKTEFVRIAPAPFICFWESTLPIIKPILIKRTATGIRATMENRIFTLTGIPKITPVRKQMADRSEERRVGKEGRDGRERESKEKKASRENDSERAENKGTSSN